MQSPFPSEGMAHVLMVLPKRAEHQQPQPRHDKTAWCHTRNTTIRAGSCRQAGTNLPGTQGNLCNQTPLRPLSYHATASRDAQWTQNTCVAGSQGRPGTFVDALLSAGPTCTHHTSRAGEGPATQLPADWRAYQHLPSCNTNHTAAHHTLACVSATKQACGCLPRQGMDTHRTTHTAEYVARSSASALLVMHPLLSSHLAKEL